MQTASIILKSQYSSISIYLKFNIIVGCIITKNLCIRDFIITLRRNKIAMLVILNEFLQKS